MLTMLLLKHSLTIHYTVFVQNREKLSRHRSGGVLIAVKDQLAKKVVRVSYPHNFLVVLKCGEDIVGINRKLVIIAAYIPPYGSKYSKVEMFHTLSDVILDFDSSEYAILLCGDLNAHTMLKNDLVESDGNASHMPEIENLLPSLADTKQTMINLGLPVDRANSDSKPDNSGYGESLVQLCKNNLLCIFNGRAGADQGIGKVTTTDNSVIDYVAGSPVLMPKLRTFNVNDFDAVLSDKHSAIEFSFEKKLPTLQNSDHVPPVAPSMRNSSGTMLVQCDQVPKRWDNQRASEFVSHVNQAKINELLLRVEREDVEKLTSDIKGIMIEAALATFGARGPKVPSEPLKSRKRCTVKMSQSLRAARKDYHRAKKTHWRLRTEASKCDLLHHSKTYKKEFNKAVRAQNRDFITSLRKAKSKDPKLYWNMLQDKKDTQMPINLQEFYEHFKNLSQSDADETTSLRADPELDMTSLDTESLNAPFTDSEILARIKQLKNGKAAGCDGVINEFIKHSAPQLVPLYTALFNKILQTSHVPKEWLIGLILPLYKNKGDPSDADNYRGITLLSCFGKLFTAALNHRLYKFCDENLILQELQAGFRHGYATTDHIFLLHCLIDLYSQNKKRLFACFVDYAKAFDSVSRSALWSKLLSYGIKGSILDVIKSMYRDIKSCVSLQNNKSQFFTSHRGVRQGENLSPLLFSLFVNDLEEFMLKYGCKPIQSGVEELDSLMKLMVIMYADDTIILSDSALGLQKALNALQDYCKQWQLQVNCEKTKVLVFGKRKVIPSKYKFTYDNSPIEITQDFKYLGLKCNYNGSFKPGVEELIKQGSRAMYALISKCRKFKLPVDLQLELFDSLVVPILTYNCEIWGLKHTNMIEKLHLKFMKFVLNVKTSTCNSMVYGELGRYPLHIRVKKQMVGFWAKTLQGKSNKLSCVMMNVLHNMQRSGLYSSPWLLHVKGILDHCGLSNVWNTPKEINVEWLKNKVSQVLKDQFYQEWRQDLGSKSSCDIYLHLKDKIAIEKYLLLANARYRKAICQLRTNNSRLPKVTGRYHHIPRVQRFCTLCEEQKLGDEYHLIVECQHSTLVELRKKYVPRLLLQRPSTHKCMTWLRSPDLKDIKALGCFLKEALQLY